MLPVAPSSFLHPAGVDQWLCQEQKRQARRCPLCNCDPVTGESNMTASAILGHLRTVSTASGEEVLAGLSWGGRPVEELVPSPSFLRMTPEGQRPRATRADGPATRHSGDSRGSSRSTRSTASLSRSSSSSLISGASEGGEGAGASNGATNGAPSSQFRRRTSGGGALGLLLA